jgi:hypothetical protein
MKPTIGGTGSPIKIDYELYNEQFGEGSSGKLSTIDDLLEEENQIEEELKLARGG